MTEEVFTKTEAALMKKGLILSHPRDYEGPFFMPQSHLLNLSYVELEEKNLEVKRERQSNVTSDQMKEKFLNYLEEEKGIKAVTVCFTDMEGSLHALDYDKNHVIASEDNLTFDGSSIKGFTAQHESDLRLKIDWSSFRWIPADLFGAGKVMVFSNVCDKDGSLYHSDFRSRLSTLSSELKKEKGITVNIAPEVEGFIFKGVKAEQEFDENKGFELATMSGYFSSLPQDILRLFIDKLAEVKRALGFENEKDHPEVAPSQFELNFKYTIALDSADQIQIYKLLARQVAKSMGLTASFLPKPIQEINGSGMHTNMSFSRDGRNIFYDGEGEFLLSEEAHKFLTGILFRAKDLCLVMNSSVNSYRRLDPAFEAPNEIKVSSVDRGSMIRIPLGNEKSARIEVRTVAPDANPYLYIFALIKAGLMGIEAADDEYMNMRKDVHKEKAEMLPGNIHEAVDIFKNSKFMADIMGKENRDKYCALKERVAFRSAQALGNKVKNSEVKFHHEVTNQLLWNDF